MSLILSHISLPCLNSVCRLLLFLVSTIAMLGCDGAYDEDARLRQVASVLSDPDLSKPHALSILDTLTAIPSHDLSEGERHYRDFLIIKAADKGYITHTSDSLYLTVKDYFSDHHRKEMLPEVLYYGGRVYSDMGVYPIALQYFRDALALMGRSRADMNLRQRALSQTGRLLSALDLHGDALPYVEESIALAEAGRDTLSWIYDLQLAGDISDRINDYSKASRYFREVLPLSERKYPKENAFTRFRLGKISLSTGDTVAALHAFDTIISGIASEYRNYALPVAAQAYLEAGNPDKAYLYARELVENPESLNKKIGYRLLVSPGIRERLHPDTLNLYLLALDSILQDTRKETMARTARLQHTVYNYTIHDRMRMKAERERERMKLWFAIAAGFTLLLLLGFTLRELIGKERLMQLWRMRAKGELIKRGGDSSSSKMNILLESSKNAGKKLSEEKRRLKEQAGRLSEKAQADPELSGRLMKVRESDACRKVRDSINRQTCIPEGDKLWEELKVAIENIFPNFIDQLHRLTEERLTLAEEHTALLVKCGFGVQDMATALGRTTGAIGARRDSISKKIFHEAIGAKRIDALLRAL